MKKLIIWFVVACMILCCGSCGNGKTNTESNTPVIKDNESSSVQADKNEGKKTDAENNAPEINDGEASSAQDNETETGMLVETEYFTLTAPDTWKDDCVYEVNADGDSCYVLIFYDKASRDAGSGGQLCSVRLLTKYDDYTYFPDYEVLGSIEVNGMDSYNLIVLYPTDVQCSEETSGTYGEMFNAIPDILDTLTVKDGCVFSKTPVEVEAE